MSIYEYESSPEIDTLKVNLATLQKAQYEAKETIRKQKQKEFSDIKKLNNSWDWKFEKKEITEFFTREKLNGIQISKKIKDEVIEQFKDIVCNDDKRWNGMFYYRTDENILHHDGGGTYILKCKPMLCSDEEWNMICSGNIPEKFLFVASSRK